MPAVDLVHGRDRRPAAHRAWRSARRSRPATRRPAAIRAYYMVNCAHPTHFRDASGGGAWLERIGGMRANASKMSHAELDEAPELDAGDPEELAPRLPRADAARCRTCGCSAAAAAPTTGTSGRSAMPAATPMPPEAPTPAAGAARGRRRPRPPRRPRERGARRATSGRGWRSRARTPFAVGTRRAARDEGAFSWRNAVIAELGGAVAGGLVAYRIGDAPEPLDDAADALPAAAGAGEPGARHPLRQRARDLSRVPAARRGVAAARRGRAAGRRGARAEPDRRRPQPAGAAALRGVRLRGGGARSRWSRRAGGPRAGPGC